MSRKRNKPTKSHNVGEQAPPHKRLRHNSVSLDNEQTLQIQPSFEHPVLSLYFAKLCTLRDYFTQVLDNSGSGSRILQKLKAINSSNNADLCSLLDTTLIGLSVGSLSNIEQEIADATQSTAGTRQPAISQSEVVDLVLQILFLRSRNAPKASRAAIYPGKPNHILTLGYKLHQGPLKSFPGGFNPGQFSIQVVNSYPNSHVNRLKGPLWTKLLEIVEEEVMLKLLLDTSIFIRLDKTSEKNTYYQLCGPPISDAINNQPSVVKTPGISNQSYSGTLAGRDRRGGTSLKHPMPEIEKHHAKNRNQYEATLDLPVTTANDHTRDHAKVPDKFTPGEILFVRSRMFYSKPACNGKGNVKFGLRHIHVLNRFPTDALHVLKYIFPRQFNLHNVFTSEVDRKETIQRHKDYTLREREISLIQNNLKNGREIPLPKRLRGKPLDLAVRLQILHRNCPYHALLNNYCPVTFCDPGALEERVITYALEACEQNDILQPHLKQSGPSHKNALITAKAPETNTIIKESFTDFTSTFFEVCGFVKAVIKRVVPKEFFGISDKNRELVLCSVEKFVKLRRYETLSLHDVLQGLKLTDVEWLQPKSSAISSKMSSSDSIKRRQLLSEFLYWLFDSFVIPLLQAHFYITESNVNRNRVYYFRHDVWKKLSEPALNNLRVSMFEELKQDRVKKILEHRKLGFSAVRLLPKEQGVRPIINLRKRGMIIKNGRTVLTPSINTLMKPVFDVLSFEKSRNPRLMRSSLFSIGDMYPKLKKYRARLVESNLGSQKLYFAKVDVQSCFDTIPQAKLIELVKKILEEEEYRIDKYVEVSPPMSHMVPDKNGVKRPMKKFTGQAKPIDDFELFADFAGKIGKNLKPGTVLVDDVVSRPYEQEDLLKLLKNHLKNNLIKIGKKYYRQKTGIPQGSILSSILCTFFYGELEASKLDFITDDCLLLRMIDDFLFITQDKTKAVNFLQIMHDGLPEYGVQVNTEKSLVNFDVEINGRKIKQLETTLEFPYCGNLIHTKSLEIRRDRSRKCLKAVGDSLTVEYSKRPGCALIRKTVHTFKIQSHAMYFDTQHNSTKTVVKNIYHAFVEAAMKFHRYTKALKHSKPFLNRNQLQVAVLKLLEIACVMLKSRERNSEGHFRCDVTRSQVKWLGAHAFRKVLQKKKQFLYKEFLEWLEELECVEKAECVKRRVLVGVGGLTMEPFEGFRY